MSPREGGVIKKTKKKVGGVKKSRRKGVIKTFRPRVREGAPGGGVYRGLAEGAVRGDLKGDDASIT